MGEEKGALCAQAHTPAVLCPHCGRVCNCGEPPDRDRDRDPALGDHSPPLLRQLTIAAVSELAVLSNLQFGGVGGGDAVTGLHAVPLFQLRESAHEAGIGSIQRGDALFLWAKRTSVGHRMGSRLQRVPNS